MFLSARQDQARLPVLILTGFLGSGKTTLVNRLLKDARLAGTAVAVNEFGEVPLDGHLIEHGAEKTIVLANGCLCCNVLGDMEDAVMRIFARAQSGGLPAFQRLIIEPSGLADPAPIAQAILRNPVLARAFRLAGIAATADALFCARQLAGHDETAKQIAMADAIVITKTDMAPAEDVARLRGTLRRLNPVANIAGAFEPAEILPPGFIDPSQPGLPPRRFFLAESMGLENHARNTAAISLIAEAPLDWRRFEAWLRNIRLTHAPNLLRVKGILNIAGSAAPVVIHGVHHVLHGPVSLPAWPDDDTRSRIVLITRGLDCAVIETSWAGAVTDFAPAMAA